MIYYFSATGNCRHVAQEIAGAIGDKAFSIEKADPEIRISQGEVFGFVTPTYMWELPVFVREFLNRIKIAGTGDFYSFLVATYGTTPGCTGEEARRILAGRGVELSASFSIKMPDTWTPIFNLSDREKVAGLNRAADAQIVRVAEQIKSGVRGNHTERRTPYILRIFTDPIFNHERKTRNFFLDDSCIGCGLCAGQCPVQAIEIREKKPVWVKDRCALCLRCLHHCPGFAIQYGKHTRQHGQYRHP